jgi:hypothetical protein
MLRPAAAASVLAIAAAHGSMVTPRPRNSIDHLVKVNTQHCANLTGKACENGQASFWYSQGARRRSACAHPTL